MFAEGSLNKNFQDSFDKILSQHLTHDGSYISCAQSQYCGLIRIRKICDRKQGCGLGIGNCS